MLEILGTRKKSQTINHNLLHKKVMIEVITFYMTTWWGDGKIRYITKTNHFNRLSLVVFDKSIWEDMHSFLFFNRLSSVLFWNF